MFWSQLDRLTWKINFGDITTRERENLVGGSDVRDEILTTIFARHV